MKAIVHGRILLPEEEARGQALLFDDTIRAITDEETARAQADEIIDAQGAYVSPGLIDVHIHGYEGADVSDGDMEGIRRMARGLLKNGVTGFLPTTLTVAWGALETVCRQVRALMPESQAADFPGAEILGMHMEGPFINPEKKGAQNEAYILPPDVEKVLPFQDVIKVLTFAPEMPGGIEFARTISQKTDVALSIGHTSASFEKAMEAIETGASRATHLFNAMTGLKHREPGVVGAALNSGIYAELIADTFHVNKGIFPMLARLKPDRLVLITDALRSAGMPDGEYENGGQTFVLRGIECRLPDGTIAGSVLKLNQAVRNMRDFGQVPLYRAVRFASLNAAESAHLEKRKGSLTVGKDADIVLMDENCGVIQTIVRGVSKYHR